MEPGEQPAAAIAREIREELGVAATMGAIIGVYGGQELLVTYPNGDRCAYVTTAYECQLAPGQLVIEEDELSGVAWFVPADIAGISVQPWVAHILVDAGV